MTVVLEASLGDGNNCCRAAKVVPYRGGWASEGYSASSLDDRGSVSRSRVTKLHQGKKVSPALVSLEQVSLIQVLLILA